MQGRIFARRGTPEAKHLAFNGAYWHGVNDYGRRMSGDRKGLMIIVVACSRTGRRDTGPFAVGAWLTALMLFTSSPISSIRRCWVRWLQQAARQLPSNKLPS